MALKSGSKGDEVKTLQIKLNQLGFDIDTDGAFGKQTDRAVRQLQAIFGYDVDGIVGAGTSKLIDSQLGYNWNINNPNARQEAFNAQGAPAELGSTLKRGSAGQDVYFLQNRLAILGFQVELDGDFGPKTEAAVRDMQTLFGYDVDGVVGKGTHFLVNQQIAHNWNRNLPNAVELAQASQGGGGSANA